MPATPPRSGRKPAEDRRREIADATLRVIAAHGLGGFTALAIARELGLTDAALFRHFASKSSMVDAAIDRVEELLFEGFPPQASDPVDRVGAFFHRRIAVIRDNPGISPLLMSDELGKAGSAEAARRVAELRQRSGAFVRSCLQEAQRAGLLAPGLGAEEAALVVLGAILALAHSRSAPPRDEVAALAPRLWRAIEHLLRGSTTRIRSAGRRPPRRSGRQSRTGESR